MCPFRIWVARRALTARLAVRGQGVVTAALAAGEERNLEVVFCRRDREEEGVRCP
jgi:hypothetical protein